MERRKISIQDLELIAPNKQIIKQLILLNSIALPINFGDINSLHYKQVLKNELAIEGVENEEDEDERGKISFFKRGDFALPNCFYTTDSD